MTGIQNAMFTLPVPPANPLIWALPPEPEEPGDGGNGGNGGNGAEPASRQQREQGRSQQGGKR